MPCGDNRAARLLPRLQLGCAARRDVGGEGAAGPWPPGSTACHRRRDVVLRAHVTRPGDVLSLLFSAECAGAHTEQVAHTEFVFDLLVWMDRAHARENHAKMTVWNQGLWGAAAARIAWTRGARTAPHLGGRTTGL